MRRTRHIRQLPRADMTPLVNIALLLIVFFVYVKQVQRSVSTPLELPDHGKYDGTRLHPIASIFLLENNRVGYLTYQSSEASATYIETDYSINGLRKHLSIAALAKRPVVYIVPTAESTFKNIVDVLDELTISKRVQFVMADYPLPTENRIIASYQHYKRSDPAKPFLTSLRLYW